MRWGLVFFVVFFILLSAMPQLKKLGLGRLPGDISFRMLGRQVELPLMSTLLLALLGLLIVRFL